ncbi:hypothetical protein A5731_28010 [Mycolicibacterium conceptionense]|jgi:hypothetical protein|uniref:Uncharacterized protein n=4 Tax=Mycolicibacterium TaxID=1866885 RepID=A0A0J8TWX1_9MYCO|nr:MULTISPECIES: hypothetical protein [Mycolicibacterium]OCB43006.1 hypothetical protein A5721_26135 [Mycolicibacterium vulneris]KLI04062.1 hypothetical protein AA982_32175 [Mycolicibacterium senegalense]KLO50436.1 hypothetical protein ABW05_01815 [Mycolicibacterium senegalense]KMV13647.1 hypothetical protein ACT17_34200 [Mycolicibacterium conceptionense]MCV7200667.1 hypothetical protein [Mycolicibacterium peregrinum]
MSPKAILRHVRVETPRTNHERHCAAHLRGKNAHFILAGDTHLVVVENDKQFRYCLPAAAEVLDLAAHQLSELRRQLGL